MRKHETILIFTKIILLSVFLNDGLPLSDVTTDILTDSAGIVAAFGDFNGDKHADVFVISPNGSSLSVHLADNPHLSGSEHSFTKLMLLENKLVSDDLAITSVVPADFDGDSQMDVMVTLETRNRSDGMVKVKIFWGRQIAVDTRNHLTLPDLVDQPLLLDDNADMIPDLFGEKKSGERYVWNLGAGRNYTENQFPASAGKKAVPLPPLRKPHSSAFVDLNNDLTADLCLVSIINGIPNLEFWYNENGVLQWRKNVTVTYEKELKVIGQFSFADFDSDQLIDIIVPACLDADCEESIILVYLQEKWIKLPVDFEAASVKWTFEPRNDKIEPSFMTFPMTLRVGDFNLDGFPDLLAVLGNTLGSTKRAVILKNVRCGADCGGYSRTFQVDWDLWLGRQEDKALVPAFFDLNDNGILDIVLTSQSSSGPKITVLEHKFADDACFIKIMETPVVYENIVDSDPPLHSAASDLDHIVSEHSINVVSGLCFYDCPGNKEPYGVNQPGPVVRYHTTDLNGNPQFGSASQLSQSAYLSLQLPYSIFGLGQTPNFIDKLEVGIPKDSDTERKRDWSSVIPNSQLVIIPNPPDTPSKWINKLFVTPSRLMLLTGAALLGTCGFIAGIVGILHWRDKIEDKKEKRQESQRFHFDAM